MRTRYMSKMGATWIAAIAVVVPLIWIGAAKSAGSLDEQLLDAAARGDVKLIKTLLGKGADVNGKDASGRTALMWPALDGKIEVVKLLLNSGADVDAKDRHGRTALMWAAGGSVGEDGTTEGRPNQDENLQDDKTPPSLASVESNTEEVVQLLLANGADVNARDEHGVTALMLATGQGELELVRHLLDKDAEVNAADDNGVTALMRVASGGVLEFTSLGVPVPISRTEDNAGGAQEMPAETSMVLDIAKLLLDKGADVNAKDKNGLTALLMAAASDDTEMVKLLRARGAQTTLLIAAMIGDEADVRRFLTEGADVNGKWLLGWTPLMAAVMRANTQVAIQLLDKGADVNVKDDFGMTPLMAAVEIGEVGLAKRLLEKGANVDETDERGLTALKLAAWVSPMHASSIELVTLLLENGAEVDKRDGHGSTALMSAALMGRENVVRLLLAKGADINAIDQSGRSALGGAAQFHETEVVKLLLAKGADVNAGVKEGNSPLVLALELSHHGGAPVDAVKMLLEKGADPNAKDKDGKSALEWASVTGQTDVVQLLKAYGAKE